MEENALTCKTLTSLVLTPQAHDFFYCCLLATAVKKWKTIIP